MSNKKNNQEKENIGDGINEFIQRNRKGIFTLLLIIIVLLIGSVVFILIRDDVDKKAALRLEELIDNFDELIIFIDNEDYDEQINDFISELETFADKSRGVSGSKAWYLLGQIHSERKDWEKAEGAYKNSASVGSRTYLGPAALFNAAAAAEEQGNYEHAIELLQQCLSHRFEFPSAPRAQFSVGRLNEKIGNFSAAIDAYRAVMINWPEMNVWPQLARNRITALEIQQLRDND
jgi:tetratricopeptide (TPR) repeat protein